MKNRKRVLALNIFKKRVRHLVTIHIRARAARAQKKKQQRRRACNRRTILGNVVRSQTCPADF